MERKFEVNLVKGQKTYIDFGGQGFSCIPLENKILYLDLVDIRNNAPHSTSGEAASLSS